jgi:hypothetical protein
MNRYLARLQKLELAMNQDAAFVSFVGPFSRLKSEDGFRKEGASVAEGFVSFVSEQNRQLENVKSGTETDRQNRQNPSGTARQLENPEMGTGHLYDGVLAALRSKCPELVEPERWLQAINDAESFLAVWGAGACALSWSAGELFGLHPVPKQPSPSFRRLSRYDAMGLVWLLHGRPVIALTATEAVIGAASGATLTYRRRQPTGIAKGTAA